MCEFISFSLKLKLKLLTVSLSSGGSRISQGAAPIYYLTNFSGKLHESEKIWLGGRPLRPLRSATVIHQNPDKGIEYFLKKYPILTF